MIRNTAPIGWIPLLFIKVFRDGAFPSFLISAFIVAAPIIFLSVFFDSYVYSLNQPQFTWVITSFNFLKVNVIDGHSKYFGDHPFWFYIVAHLPAIFNVVYPFCIYGVYLYTKETLNKNKSPEIMYMTIFYVIIFSIIAHKEKRFMLPIVAFVFLVLGYLLVRKTRVWGKKVIKSIIWLSIIGEIFIHLAYYIHHNLWVMTDYMLANN